MLQLQHGKKECDAQNDACQEAAKDCPDLPLSSQIELGQRCAELVLLLQQAHEGVPVLGKVVHLCQLIINR